MKMWIEILQKGLDYAGKQRDLVIEAVPEVVDIKGAFYQKLKTELLDKGRTGRQSGKGFYELSKSEI